MISLYAPPPVKVAPCRNERNVDYLVQYCRNPTTNVPISVDMDQNILVPCSQDLVFSASSKRTWTPAQVQGFKAYLQDPKLAVPACSYKQNKKPYLCDGTSTASKCENDAYPKYNDIRAKADQVYLDAYQAVINAQTLAGKIATACACMKTGLPAKTCVNCRKPVCDGITFTKSC